MSQQQVSETKTDGEWLDDLYAILNQDGNQATDTDCLEQAYVLLQEWSQQKGGY